MDLSLTRSDQNLGFEFDLLSEYFRPHFDLTDLETIGELDIKVM